MCFCEKFYPLETIEEELEQEDQAERSHTSDGEREDFLIQVGENDKLTEAQSEEDEVGFRVMRASRKDSCLGRRSSGEIRCSFPPFQVRLSQYENIPQHSQNSHIRSEGKKKRPRTYEKSTNGKLRKKASLECVFFFNEIQRVVFVTSRDSRI